MIHFESRGNSIRSVDVSVVPMINIVFLLLLYFLIAGRLTDVSGPEIRLPFGGGAKTTVPEAAVLHIDAADGVYAGTKRLDLAELRALLTRLAQGSTTPHLVLRADQNATVGALQRVMDVCRAAGITVIELATLNPRARGTSD